MQKHIGIILLFLYRNPVFESPQFYGHACIYISLLYLKPNTYFQTIVHYMTILHRDDLINGQLEYSDMNLYHNVD